jgi:hypothetical protein
MEGRNSLHQNGGRLENGTKCSPKTIRWNLEVSKLLQFLIQYEIYMGCKLILHPTVIIKLKYKFIFLFSF